MKPSKMLIIDNIYIDIYKSKLAASGIFLPIIVHSKR